MKNINKKVNYIFLLIKNMIFINLKLITYSIYLKFIIFNVKKIVKLFHYKETKKIIFNPNFNIKIINSYNIFIYVIIYIIYNYILFNLKYLKINYLFNNFN